MRKSTYIKLCEELLTDIFTGRVNHIKKNPAIEFVKDAKAGAYDNLSDADYNLLYSEIQEFSKLWDDGTQQTSSEILLNSMKKIKLDKNTIHSLAEILEERYEAVSQDSTLSTDLEYFIPNKRELTIASLKTPQHIYEYLSEHIHGQKEALKAASMLLYNHMHLRKRNLLFAGPTGCGKTEIWRVLKELYPYIHIIDSTSITQEGWSGSFKINDIFADMKRDEAEKSIIVFDEFDKFCEPRYNSHGNNVSADSQNELLKLIEGKQMTLPGKNGTSALVFDSSKISFVFCGSFERLIEAKTEKESPVSLGFGQNIEKQDAHMQYEKEITPQDLVTYAGIRQEIAGRINQVVQLYPMTADDYDMILCDKKISPIYQLERQYAVKLSLNEQTRQKLVTEAAESHMGVRYLHSRIQQLLDEQVFQDCTQTEYCLGD